MEPLSPNDPVGRLLGNAKRVSPRPNFTQNVLRAVRQLPQRRTLGERLADWFRPLMAPQRALVAGVAAVVLAALIALPSLRHGGADQRPDQDLASASPAASPADDSLGGVSEVAATLSDMDQLSTLLAQTDARSMTDTEVAFLLY